MKRNGNILVVGSNMIDLTTYLKRAPIKGETVFGKKFQQGFGGKGSNQAVMASLLGANVSMVTAVGNDTYGKQWQNHYKEEHINTDFVKVIEGQSSGVASIWVEADGDNRIVIVPGANEEVSPKQVREAFEQLPKPDVVLSQLENLQHSILEGFKRAKEHDAITILNPAPAELLLEDILTFTDWLVPNETELAFLAREMFQIEEQELIPLVKEFADRTDTNLVVTIGSKGALYYSPGNHKKVEIIPTVEVDVVDTTGAGDAFCGTFAYGLAKGYPPEKSIHLANRIASDSVQKYGTQTSYARGEELDNLVEQVIR